MINLENLNDQSLNEIFEEARRKIVYLNDEWTNQQESDPGITLLELFSWLKSVQHEYLNRISPGVKRKFLKLLNVQPYKNRGAKALIQVSDLEKDISIPRGLRWLAGRMPFENLEPQFLTSADIVNVIFENPDYSMLCEYYKFDGNRKFGLFGDKFRTVDKNLTRKITINFDRPFVSNEIINLYFEVFLEKGLIRTPVEDSDEFLDMAEVLWEYYGIENGILGWHRLDVLTDNTCKFIFSGDIRFKINGSMESNNGLYSLRCTLLNEEYDFPPRITNILTNVFEVCQRYTVCDNVIIKRKDINKNMKAQIKDNLAINGMHEVYINRQGAWVQTNDFKVAKSRVGNSIILDLSNFKDEINDFAPEEDVIKFVFFDKLLRNRMVLGSGTGTSGQVIEFRDKEVLYDGFELMVGRKNDDDLVFDEWERVDDFFSSTKYDKHYILNHEREMIIFGNHEVGVAPRRIENSIKLTRLIYCRGEDSNVKKGMINKVETKDTTLSKTRITQVTKANGGRDDETIEHAQARASDIFRDSGRAVTLRDFEKIVHKTPGLIFQNVKILPNYMPGEDCDRQNCITVAVKWNERIEQKLPKSYERNIMNQIDKYRLINTKVKVVCPEYIGLIISGEVVVNSFYREKDKLIEKSIERFIEALNLDLGSTLHFGDLFGMLDRLDYISNMNKLFITPIGNYIEKTVSEDIIVPPNGSYYIKEINMNILRDSDIYRD